jgi:hypothetical protein
LVNLESVIKRTYIVFYFFSARTELDALFSLPDDAMADVSDSAASIPGMPGESHGEALPESARKFPCYFVNTVKSVFVQALHSLAQRDTFNRQVQRERLLSREPSETGVRPTRETNFSPTGVFNLAQ